MTKSRIINFDVSLSSRRKTNNSFATAGRCADFALGIRLNLEYSPITTYNGRATTKPKVDQRAHAIVYAGQTVPQKLEGENRMVKDALRVVLTSKEERLDAKSRIDFGRVYPIGHNVKVKPIGKIHEDSMPKLKDYYNLEKNRQ